MIKLVKFNLLIDGQRCRTIEDLRNNFNLLDLIEEFQSGKLGKWLNVRNFDKYFDQIKAIDKNSTLLEIAQQLCSIFEVRIDENELKNELIIVEYQNLPDEQKGNQDAIRHIIDIHHQEYLNSICLAEKYIVKKIVFNQNYSNDFFDVLPENTRIIVLGNILQNNTNAYGGFNGGTICEYKDKKRTIRCNTLIGSFGPLPSLFTFDGLSIRFANKNSKYDTFVLYVIDFDNQINSDSITNAKVELLS